MPHLKKQKNNIGKVSSLNDLRYKCNNDVKKDKYQQLAVISAKNLGCPQPNPTLNEAFKWLEINISESSVDGFDGEQGVTDEINFCRDLVE